MRRLSCLCALALLPAAALAHDPYSYAQPDQVRVSHLDLDLDLDFSGKTLKGHATLDLDWRSRAAKTLVLDTRDLHIRQISAVGKDGRTTVLNYQLAKADPQLGSKLTIQTPQHPARIRIDYSTSPTASGLQWLSPAQTADHSQPFMFSQSESIHARSWVPLQDSPVVRFSYDAHIHAPSQIRVVMSAINDANHPLNGDFRFDQPRAIPSYLLAIAAGHIAVKTTGPRSAVYAEPGMDAKAAHEFEDTEKLIETAEHLYGPYRWGRYDLLVLPPSFPFGGMENPNMTFATPTIVVGDKSLVSVISHELAHSWSGNLVTNASWRDGWLNEGFTTYVQGRITEAVYGKALADEEDLIAIRELQQSLPSIPQNAQKLAPPPLPVTADDALSELAYTKGSWFLRFLEARYGRQVFDAYLRGYFDHFAFQSITTEQMLAYLKVHLYNAHPGKVQWSEIVAWVYGPGIPQDAPIPHSARFDAIDQARAGFLAGRLTATGLQAQGWNTQEWEYFLDGLPAHSPLQQLQALDAAWHLTGTPNAEIGVRWYSHAIAAGDKAVWPAAREQMTRIGRLILTLPIYSAFAATPEGKAYAEAAYQSHRDGYHPLTQQAIEHLLQRSQP